MYKLNRSQLGFLVFVVLPAILGYLIRSISFTVDYKEHPHPGIIASWNTWHAYEHEWCYVVAAICWFSAALWFLKERK